MKKISKVDWVDLLKMTEHEIAIGMHEKDGLIIILKDINKEHGFLKCCPQSDPISMQQFSEDFESCRIQLFKPCGINACKYGPYFVFDKREFDKIDHFYNSFAQTISSDI